MTDEQFESLRADHTIIMSMLSKLGENKNVGAALATEINKALAQAIGIDRKVPNKQPKKERSK